jgi:branched-chain amino acid transport system ATP-binding protein
MLKGSKVTKRFGGLLALNMVDFEVNKGEIVGLIGPNGSGKTTLFNVISGIYKLDSGKIEFDGADITTKPIHERCKLGIGRTFQVVRPFNELDLVDNVKMGCMFGRQDVGERDRQEKALELLDFVGLTAKKHQKAEQLNLIDKKRLEIARALATSPHMLLLDEVFAGLDPAEMSASTKLLLRIRDELGVTEFWVEHVMRAIMNTAERLIVLNIGEKIAEGTPSEIARNVVVIKAYLGEKFAKVT